ncbi:hypothetical protein NEOLEDRAFT_1170552 [Neolentinus lepideus HHB14362 ss-1]|uniref:Uncharacterized protein n=1 Tax=Neolentinus lepideus HHB14362 ss-1 TaxID=1314782 RepID=A0A165RIG5_9AGAM|nr:hypothetical protein NEOLEDRAFT_1170552 [Neolentinus lepideus HHB14362 ss-1]
MHRITFQIASLYAPTYTFMGVITLKLVVLYVPVTLGTSVPRVSMRSVLGCQWCRYCLTCPTFGTLVGARAGRLSQCHNLGS